MADNSLELASQIESLGSFLKKQADLLDGLMQDDYDGLHGAGTSQDDDDLLSELNDLTHSEALLRQELEVAETFQKKKSTKRRRDRNGRVTSDCPLQHQPVLRDWSTPLTIDANAEPILADLADTREEHKKPLVSNRGNFSPGSPGIVVAPSRPDAPESTTYGGFFSVEQPALRSDESADSLSLSDSDAPSQVKSGSRYRQPSFGEDCVESRQAKESFETSEYQPGRSVDPGDMQVPGKYLLPPSSLERTSSGHVRTISLGDMPIPSQPLQLRSQPGVDTSRVQNGRGDKSLSTDDIESRLPDGNTERSCECSTMLTKDEQTIGENRDSAVSSSSSNTLTRSFRGADHRLRSVARFIHRWFMSSCIVLVIIVLLGSLVSITIVLGRHDDSVTKTNSQGNVQVRTSVPTFAPSASPSSPFLGLNPSDIKVLPIVNPELYSYVLSISPDRGLALQDPSSPQFAAYAWLANSSVSGMTTQSVIQRYVLATLYFSTDGDGWLDNTGWLSDEDECDWFSTAASSVCDNAGKVTRLELRQNDLSGSLPPEVSLLGDGLVTLALSGGPERHLTGTIPASLADLRSLEELDLSGNGLEGDIPDLSASADTLATVELHNNRLEGTVPDQLAILEKLTTLSLHANLFTGSIPREVCSRFQQILSYVNPYILSADCAKLDCPCCNFCCTSEGGCTCRFVNTDEEWRCL